MTVDIGLATIVEITLKLVAISIIVFFFVIYFLRSLPIFRMKRKKNFKSMIILFIAMLTLVLLFIGAIFLTSPYNPFSIATGIVFRGSNFWGILYIIVSAAVFMIGYMALEDYFEETERETANPIFMIMFLALMGIFCLILMTP